MPKYEPRTAVPTYDEINRMSLNEINSQIKHLAYVANKRIAKLENKAAGDNVYAESLRYQQKTAFAGGYGKRVNNATGTARNYSQAKAKTLAEGRARLAALKVGLSAKTSTLKGISDIDRHRKSTFENMLGMKLKPQQYKDLAKLLQMANTQGLDSNQIIDTMQIAFENKVFDSYDDAKKFILSKDNNLSDLYLNEMLDDRPNKSAVLKSVGGTFEWVKN